MNTTFTELDLLKEVDKKFSSLSPEAQKRVMDWLGAKYNLSSKASEIPDKPTSSEGEKTLLKDFLLEKKPNGQYEKIACIVYYLEKYAGFNGCKTIDITNANNEARQPKIPNPALYVKHTTFTYGYLTSIGKGQKGISAKGEAVVEALPDRDKVTAALKDHSIKRTVKKAK